MVAEITEASACPTPVYKPRSSFLHLFHYVGALLRFHRDVLSRDRAHLLAPVCLCPVRLRRRIPVEQLPLNLIVLT